MLADAAEFLADNGSGWAPSLAKRFFLEAWERLAA
jgi:hypothetical protein